MPILNSITETKTLKSKFLYVLILSVKFVLIYFIIYYILSEFLTYKVFTLIGKFYIPILTGILNTILISLFAIILGTIIGSISAYFLTSYPDQSFTKVVLNILIYIFLSIPALVLIQLIYYKTSFGDYMSTKNAAILVSILALGVNLSPFVSKILGSSIKNFPIDQINSAKAFGFSKYDILKKFKLPFIMKHSLQSLLVEYYTTIKLSSLLSVIGVAESFHRTKDIIDKTNDPMSGYILLSICYIALIVPIAIFADNFEKKIRNNNKSNG